MYSYTLAREINSQLFKETCDKIEKSFPFVEKKKLLIDVDGSLLQDYFINGKKIRVQNDSLLLLFSTLFDFPEGIRH